MVWVDRRLGEEITINGKPFDLVYPEEYYIMHKKQSPQVYKRVVNPLYDEFKPKSVIDIGCGIGADLYYFKELGVEVKGLDASSYAQKHKMVDEVEQWDIRRRYRFKKTYDLCICFDTIEHIEPEYESKVLRNIIISSNTIAISVPFLQGDPLHHNEQPHEYWILKFQELDYIFDIETTLKLKLVMKGGRHWVVRNLLIFKWGQKWPS